MNKLCLRIYGNYLRFIEQSYQWRRLAYMALNARVIST
jgi:hypothetical protein